MLASSQSGYEFDVALSFAGQDRRHAKVVARAMQAKGLRVFYDKDHSAQLWGKNRSEFERIYGSASAYVVPFISKHYVTRDSTVWEFETAKREARTRKDEFILPVKIDDTRVFGLPDDHIYLSIDAFNPEEIAQALIEKLTHSSRRRRRAEPPRRRQVAGAMVLTRDARSALGLIATALVPLTPRHFEQFFPTIKWSRHLRSFVASNLVRSTGGCIVASQSVERAFRDEKHELASIWRSRLEELADHIDCAMLLSLHYFCERRFDDAVRTLTAVAQSLEPGMWIRPYTEMLAAVSVPKVYRTLRAETRLAFRHSFAHCLSACGRHKEALEQLQLLRRISQRRHDSHTLGLALLNIGVNFHKLGDTANATRWYRRARRHGEKHGDAMLASHAVGNLGQLALEDAPSTAIALLKQALSLKDKCNDRVGIAGTLQVMAVANAKLERYSDAFDYYDKAEVITKELDLRHLRTILLDNRAHTQIDCGKQSAALRTARRALRIATDEGFIDFAIRSREKMARIYFARKDLMKAELSLTELLRLSVRTEAVDFMITAHHGLAIVYAIQQKTTERDHHFWAAVRIARNHKRTAWLVRARVDMTRDVTLGDFGPPDLTRLRRYALAEKRRGDDLSAGAVLDAIASHIEVSGDFESAMAIHENALELFHKATDGVDFAFSAYQTLAQHRWDAGHFEKAMCWLQQLESFATKHLQPQKCVAALDQRGTCLQELNRHAEALRLHQRAAKSARRLGLRKQLLTSLHNLGECHRRMKSYRRAIDCFQEAKSVATELDDFEAFTSAQHSEALVYSARGEFSAARSILEQCRYQAARYEKWAEHIRAWEALGNLSWQRGRAQTAVRQYNRALKECEDHNVDWMCTRIALNCARLLKTLGQPKKACQLLSKYIDQAGNDPSAQELHSTMAELYLECRQHEEAEKHFLAAKDAAVAIGDADEATYCASQLAEVYRVQNNHSASTQLLDGLLKGEMAVEDRGTILKQLFEVLFESEQSNRAQTVFDEAQAFFRKHGLIGHLIDLYMMVFDENWKGDRKARLNALQMYAVATLEAFRAGRNDKYLDKIFGHVLKTMVRQPTASTPRQLAWLSHNLKKWLVERFGANAKVIAILDWPIRSSQRLLPFAGDPQKLHAEFQRMNRENDTGDGTNRPHSA